MALGNNAQKAWLLKPNPVSLHCSLLVLLASRIILGLIGMSAVVRDWFIAGRMPALGNRLGEIVRGINELKMWADLFFGPLFSVLSCFCQ